MFILYAAELAGRSKTEDDFAVLRDERDFKIIWSMKLSSRRFCFY